MRRITLKDRDRFKELLLRYHVSEGNEKNIAKTIEQGQKNYGTNNTF